MIVEEQARRIAREEIASLCGLVLKRLQENAGTVSRTELNEIFGEALRDFSTDTDEPGEK